jgi:hypothetical protein
VILTSGSHAWLFVCQWVLECAVWLHRETNIKLKKLAFKSSAIWPAQSYLAHQEMLVVFHSVFVALAAGGSAAISRCSHRKLGHTAADIARIGGHIPLSNLLLRGGVFAAQDS